MPYDVDHELREMARAPRDGTLIRLWPYKGRDFTGYYSTKFWGWVSYQQDVPLVRGDLAFAGWEPVDSAVALNSPMEKARRRRGPPMGVRVER